MFIFSPFIFKILLVSVSFYAISLNKQTVKSLRFAMKLLI